MDEQPVYEKARFRYGCRVKLTAFSESWTCGRNFKRTRPSLIRDVIALYHEQMSFGAEIVELSEMFFKDHVDYEEEGQEVLNGEQVPEVLRAFAGQIEALEAMEPAKN